MFPFVNFLLGSAAKNSNDFKAESEIKMLKKSIYPASVVFSRISLASYGNR